MQFLDRSDAGKKLAQLLVGMYCHKSVVVYALPRGGVVTGYEVARQFGMPLRIVVTRKIGHPLEPEYAIAAMGEEGNLVHETSEIDRVNQVWLAREICKQKHEIQRRKDLYGAEKRQPSLKGKIALLIDDGIATGLTMRAAIAELKLYSPQQIVVAVPVIAPSVKVMLEKEGVTVQSLIVDPHFSGVGAYYMRFPQVSDDEVISFLKKSRNCDENHRMTPLYGL